MNYNEEGVIFFTYFFVLAFTQSPARTFSWTLPRSAFPVMYLFCPVCLEVKREMLCIRAGWWITRQFRVLISLPNYRRGLILHRIFSSEALCKVYKKIIIREVLENDSNTHGTPHVDSTWGKNCIHGYSSVVDVMFSECCYAVLGILNCQICIVHLHLSKLTVDYSYLLLTCSTMYIDDFCFYTQEE